MKFIVGLKAPGNYLDQFWSSEILVLLGFNMLLLFICFNGLTNTLELLLILISAN